MQKQNEKKNEKKQKKTTTTKKKTVAVTTGLMLETATDRRRAIDTCDQWRDARVRYAWKQKSKNEWKCRVREDAVRETN